MTTYNPQIEELVDEVGINKLCPDFHNVNTLGEVQALNIYSHLSGSPKLAAENDLLARVLGFNGEDDLSEMSINHTNGAVQFYAGTGVAVSSGIGGGLDGNHVFVPTPALNYWKTHDIVAKAKTLIVKTNIVAGNLPSNDIFVYLTQGFKDSANSATSGQRTQVSFGASSGAGDGTHGVIASGPVYAGNVGDLGTFYAQIDLPAELTNENQIGSGNPFDTHYYYIIGFQVNAESATKLYKFAVMLQYE